MIQDLDDGTTNSWLSLLKSLKLSKAERLVVERFSSGQVRLGFLPVVDLLRHYGYLQEGFELLAWGVKQNPDYWGGKVFLSREMYARGMVAEAWELLESGQHGPLRQNLMAQNILFRASIVLGYENRARSLLRYLAQANMLDRESEKIARIIETQGFSSIRNEILNLFKQGGFVVSFREDPEVAAMQEPTQLLPSAEMELSHKEVAQGDDTLFDNYQLVALEDVFKGRFLGEDEVFIEGPEFDTVTLAQIYEDQGHYKKALDIFRRLLRIVPSNSFLQKSVDRVTGKYHEQARSDLSVDPGLPDHIDRIEEVRRQREFFQGLLEALGRRKLRSSQEPADSSKVP